MFCLNRTFLSSEGVEDIESLPSCPTSREKQIVMCGGWQHLRSFQKCLWSEGGYNPYFHLAIILLYRVTPAEKQSLFPFQTFSSLSLHCQASCQRSWLRGSWLFKGWKGSCSIQPSLLLGHSNECVLGTRRPPGACLLHAVSHPVLQTSVWLADPKETFWLPLFHTGFTAWYKAWVGKEEILI